MPNVFDNIDTPFLENDLGIGLKDALKVANRGDFCVGYFNLRGWRCIDSVVNSWSLPATEEQPPPCRLLVGMQRLPQEQLRAWLADSPDRPPDLGQLAKLRKEAAKEFRKQLTVGHPTDADEAGLKRLVKQLRERRLVVNLFLKHALHAKLYLAHRSDKFNPIIAYLGSSNLTMSGLKGQGELNIDVPDGDASAKLHQWFLDRWDDSRCLDITEELIEIIGESWAGEKLVPPYHVYLKMAWHLSQDARDGIKEFRVPRDIRDKLLPFQEKAVQLACRHLNKQGGVLVGDVVGLGKTRIAAAIARVMADDQMLETLILCPKNLTKMWEDYAHEFGLRSPKVMSQSIAQRDLPDLVRYRLVIIDESHNFRNKEGRIYKAIQEYLERNTSKVILLTATPYNKTYLDLGAQLRLFLPDQKDIGIRPEAMLRKEGESKFALKNPNIPVTSLAAFEKSEEPDDWRDIMRLFLVRRTRSFIIRNYATKDERNGLHYLTLPTGERMYFPVRKPKSVKFRSDPDDASDPCARLFREEVVAIIDHLNLPRYGRSLYKKDVLPPLTEAEDRIMADLSRAGKRMKGFCRTNLFKRLESSANASSTAFGKTRRSSAPTNHFSKTRPPSMRKPCATSTTRNPASSTNRRTTRSISPPRPSRSGHRPPKTTRRCSMPSRESPMSSSPPKSTSPIQASPRKPRPVSSATSAPRRITTPCSGSMRRGKPSPNPSSASSVRRSAIPTPPRCPAAGITTSSSPAP